MGALASPLSPFHFGGIACLVLRMYRKERRFASFFALQNVAFLLWETFQSFTASFFRAPYWGFVYSSILWVDFYIIFGLARGNDVMRCSQG